jgi:hypothetical protein
MTLDGAKADAESLRRARSVSTFEIEGGFEDVMDDFVEVAIESYLDDVLGRGSAAGSIRVFWRCDPLQRIRQIAEAHLPSVAK